MLGQPCTAGAKGVLSTPLQLPVQGTALEGLLGENELLLSQTQCKMPFGFGDFKAN